MARTRLPSFLTDVVARVDERLVGGWYRSLSVPTARVRAKLRREHRPFVDPSSKTTPPLIDLDATARWVIDQARFNATALGGLAGLGGLASVPPEIAATVIGTIRLGQRLAIVYGFDPETDRGQMVLWRALAAGFEVALPDRGPVGMRVSDLPAVVAPGVLAPRTVATRLAAQMVRKATVMVVGRATRLLPVLSAGTAAADGRQRMNEVGDRMRQVYRQAAEVPGAAAPDIEEAEEVGLSVT